MTDTSTVRARLWDGPTRLVHWAFVGLVIFAWWSAETGRMGWHRFSGYVMIALLLFRITWGFWGSASARFTSFIKGPTTTFAYARAIPGRARTDNHPGHNPLGGWSAVAILVTLVVQVSTGLFAVDVDAIEAGPLSDRVDFDTGRLLAKWHHWSFWALEVLIVLHLAAIAFYLVYKRTNLISPMITGVQDFANDPKLAFAPLWRAGAAAAFGAVAAWWISKGLHF